MCVICSTDDSTRVKLISVEADDPNEGYINASYITVIVHSFADYQRSMLAVLLARTRVYTDLTKSINLKMLFQSYAL